MSPTSRARRQREAALYLDGFAMGARALSAVMQLLGKPRTATIWAQNLAMEHAPKLRDNPYARGSYDALVSAFPQIGGAQ